MILDPFHKFSYWHEYLDLVYLFKCIISKSDHNISIKASARETRTSNTNNGILLNVAKPGQLVTRTVFYVRTVKVWNTLPFCIRSRDTNKSLASFKLTLLQYFKDLTEKIYDPN